MRTAIRLVALELAHKWLKHALKWGVVRTKFYFDSNDIDILNYDKVVRVTVKVMTHAEYEEETESNDVKSIEYPKVQE